MAKIWIDGCFDFAHHGHAGAMMQARQQGDELYVGVHNDDDILINKGPPVMTLEERMIAVNGCRWCTEAVPDAPYVTDPKVMDEYGCKYVVHGDDITTDKDGKDCYAEVKEMGRFIVVKRTPNISTTDLVGRMLLFSKDHHIKPITEEDWVNKNSLLLTVDSIESYRKYATASDAKSPGVQVFLNCEGHIHKLISGSQNIEAGKKAYFVNGGFDLFNPGHILLLKKIKELATADNAIVVVGVSDDYTVSHMKGSNYPIMNLFERSLCVLQSKYIDVLILASPEKINAEFLETFANVSKHEIVKILHGPTKMIAEDYDGLDVETVNVEKFKNMDVSSIVDRVIANREAFEERQRRKGWKREVEAQLEAKEKEKAV
ncbi:hypothetical protein CANINC_004187 [Pichia inconspicua]|uniref:ethanolamine-phosphate cytidylyltransferase n=1 Tax=Pichia inconspicua TaxID=52247 RepID=A0A4T0WWS8_9ASCO|nr:hypothetical protein CANINC_004187 [[Candida] inconspicua]